MKNSRKNNTVDYQDFVNINSPSDIRKKFDIGDIWSNTIKCKSCNDIVRSLNRHDLRHCKC